MTYLEILSWARKGMEAEKGKLREMQDKAVEGQFWLKAFTEEND